MNRIGLGLASVMLVVAAGAAGAASAADPDFCRDYARDGVSQVREAYDRPHCRWLIDRNPARWTLEYRNHFNWCLGVSRDAADRERDARRDGLDRCRRDEGWGPEGGPGWRRDGDHPW